MTANIAKLRTPPHSIEAEQSVIGAVLFEPKCWARVTGQLKIPDFYRADHRVLWAAICSAHEAGTNADGVTVCDRLQRAGMLDQAGGREYVAGVVRDTPSAANVEAYAKIVREHSALRRLADLGAHVQQLVFEPNDRSAPETLALAAQMFGELQGAVRVGRGLVEVGKLVGELWDDLDRRKAGERGLSVGLPDFDGLTYGLDPGDLVVLAGRPGMGKTSVMVSAAAHASVTDNVAVFSAEMPAKQLMRRCVALLGQIEQTKLRKVSELNDFDWQQIAEGTDRLAQRRLWVDDTSAPSMDHVRAELMALAARSKLGLAIVDYVQLVKGDGRTRYDELRDIAYAFKGLAKTVNVPIILLAQLNRSVESRDNKRPTVSDMRDSGALEEAADIVGLLYSESYYDPDFPISNVLECAIEKNRNGPKGLCLWKFLGEFSRVVALDQGARAEYRREVAKRRHRGAKDDDL